MMENLKLITSSAERVVKEATSRIVHHGKIQTEISKKNIFRKP